MSAALRRTTACSSMPLFIELAPAFLGAIFRRATATGRQRISASGDGAKVGFLLVFSALRRLMRILNTCRSTRPASAPTSTAQAPKKSWTGPSHRQIPRRADNQDPRHRLRARQSGRSLTHAGAGARHHPVGFLADKGHDSDALVATLNERGITPVIPSKANRREPRQTDFALYRERNLVERFFCKLKQYRAISTRYDKLANTFLAAVAMVSVLRWLN